MPGAHELKRKDDRWVVDIGTLWAGGEDPARREFDVSGTVKHVWLH